MRALEKERNINSAWLINTNQQMPEHQERLLNDLSSIDRAISRHPISNASSASSAKVQHERLFVFSPNTRFEPTYEGNPKSYIKFRAYAVLPPRWRPTCSCPCCPEGAC
jgi:hypothetical protein